MKTDAEKIPTPKELEKEISEFLSKKFGGQVKVATPLVVPQEAALESEGERQKKSRPINFDLKPEQLIHYLDQYIVKQDQAKAILATKICTHFNRIKHYQQAPDDTPEMVGSIKNNVLMIGPTGVGKTYMIRLIAKKIGVPFIKGDATKFSETGYVGGDVEDLVRDLVREADGDIERAAYGIIYIDEIDKIASSRQLIGADVSRTGVQRALLKPMEETEVDLKVPHDPISMLQEVERYRKTGKREKNAVSTRNILFIMSGAFSELPDIIGKRIKDQGIGFGASIAKPDQLADILQQVKSEDLIRYGFESEFVGRLPVRAVFEHLTRHDLFEILKNPNNPIILGKKLDFAAYGIDIKFSHKALALLAQRAFDENTGARGLVSAIEGALLSFEKKLPSTPVRKLPITDQLIQEPEKALQNLTQATDEVKLAHRFDQLAQDEKEHIRAYVKANLDNLTLKHNLPLTDARIDIVATYYVKNALDIESVVQRIKSTYDTIKTLELYFYKKFDINIVLEDSAIDYIIEQIVHNDMKIDDMFRRMAKDFELGLKLVQEKTARNRFFITREALTAPEAFVSSLIQKGMQPHNTPEEYKDL